jgi:glycosyltransferase involved in cell wall biosynthesis
MKLLLIGNYANDKQVSINRFVGLMDKGMRQVGWEVRRIQAEPVVGKLYPGAYGLGKWLGYIDKLLIFPFQLCQARDWADLVCICDQSFSYYIPYLKNKTHLIICHDLLAIRSALGEIPESPLGWTGKQYQNLIYRGFQQAQYVACSSPSTQADVLRLTSIPPERTFVIEDCLDENYAEMPREEALERTAQFPIDFNAPFIIHVGGNQWYKNRFGLLQIFNYLQKYPELQHWQLVMVSRPLDAQMQDFVKEHNLEKKVIELVGVPNDDLRALYSLATAMIFPSLQEGFGVPPIEAQACGCATFVSNRLPMTEISAEAAVYFNPKDCEGAAAIIAPVLLNPEKMAQMRQKGYENAQRFSFMRMMNTYDQTFRDILEKAPRN